MDCWERDRLNSRSWGGPAEGRVWHDVIDAKDGETDEVRCDLGEDEAKVGAVDVVKACEHVS